MWVCARTPSELAASVAKMDAADDNGVGEKFCDCLLTAEADLKARLEFVGSAIARIAVVSGAADALKSQRRTSKGKTARKRK